MERIVIIDGPAAIDPTRVGSKAAHLQRLHGAGFSIPPWYVVPADAMEWCLVDSGLSVEIRSSLEKLDGAMPSGKLDQVLEPLREKIEKLELPGELVEALREAHQHGILYAVRSSGLDEDLNEASLAGLHDSFLFLEGFDALLTHVKKVWASGFSTRAVAYRLRAGLPVGRILLAVIVQEMVRARVSGIMFTANPANGNVQEIVISSCWGAGEGIVSGDLAADHFRLSKDGRILGEDIASKEAELVFDSGKGTGLVRIDLPPDRRNVPSLSGAEILEIARLGRRIENLFRRPQDIEFSIDDSFSVFILQSRPITTIPEYGPAAGNCTVWDNSNIVESYSGPTSPMTLSFIRHAYTIVYHCFCEVMGVPPETVRTNRHVFENMLGFFRGRVYYNLLNWYRLIRLFPGYSYNRNFMEAMMGLKERPEGVEEDMPEPGFWRRNLVELPKMIRLVVRSLWHFSRIDQLAADFDAHFSRYYRKWRAMDFSRMSASELMEVYLEMEEKLLWNWKTPIINDFYVMISYGFLKKLCTEWCGDENGSLQNDLICGEGDIESAEPAKRLMSLARKIRSRPDVKSLFEQMSAHELSLIVPERKSLSEISGIISSYLDTYGYRCVDELKLEEPSLLETPEFLYRMIQNYLALEDQSALDPEVMERREAEIRRTAEEKVINRLKNRGLFVLRKAVFFRVLRAARKGVRNREHMRFARTRIYGVFRELLNAIGREFEAEGILKSDQDIYYLGLDEVWDFIKGTAITTRLEDLVKIRKREFLEYRKPDSPVPDDRFTTCGIAYHRNLFRSRRDLQEAAESGDLQGIGCCPGIVRGRIRILQSPREDLGLNGEILAAARTDPGWVPLYPALSGILIERGSILSHSAIVAREMGIPTIVGIPGLLDAVEDGVFVSMDGTTGVVEILENAPDQS